MLLMYEWIYMLPRSCVIVMHAKFMHDLCSLFMHIPTYLDVMGCYNHIFHWFMGIFHRSPLFWL
jgi:hypothetical protein